MDFGSPWCITQASYGCRPNLELVSPGQHSSVIVHDLRSSLILRRVHDAEC